MRLTACFGQECPKEYGVREVADDEENVVAVADVLNGNRSDLSNQGVESKGHHDTKRDTLGTSARVEYF